MDKLLKFINSLPTAEQAQFAARCGTTIGYLRKACSIGNRLGADIAILIERESGGIVTCDMVRPDVDWSFLRSSRTPQPTTKEPAAAGV